jgi:hypothetical protein
MANCSKITSSTASAHVRLRDVCQRENTLQAEPSHAPRPPLSLIHLKASDPSSSAVNSEKSVPWCNYYL